MNEPADLNTSPNYSDIIAAAERLTGIAVRTPLLESTILNDVAGGRVLLKAETLQRTGSFKIRGAYNFVSQLDEAQLRQGVVAYSSGNHAQGVAAAAGLLGAPATIVMPSDAPAIKLNNTRALGANVVTYDRHSEPREEIAAQLAVETGATMCRLSTILDDRRTGHRGFGKSSRKPVRLARCPTKCWCAAAAVGSPPGSPLYLPKPSLRRVFTQSNQTVLTILHVP